MCDLIGKYAPIKGIDPYNPKKDPIEGKFVIIPHLE
jgi:hypothetical protein